MSGMHATGKLRRFLSLVRREREMFRDGPPQGTVVQPSWAVAPGEISVRTVRAPGRIDLLVRTGGKEFLFLGGTDPVDLERTWLACVARDLWGCESMEEMELLLEAGGF